MSICKQWRPEYWTRCHTGINGHVPGGDTTAGMGMRRLSSEQGSWGTAAPWVHTSVMCSWSKGRAYSSCSWEFEEEASGMLIFLHKLIWLHQECILLLAAICPSNRTVLQVLTHCLSNGMKKPKQPGFLSCLM